MPEISLTDFVDFVAKAGTPKLTKVRQIIDRKEYDPAIDYWKALRDAIIRFHRKGKEDKAVLDSLLREIKDPRKLTKYSHAITGYKKFLGRKKFRWFIPPRELWSCSGLEVTINPELGLSNGSDRLVVKLYFKEERLGKRKNDLILHLMESSLRKSSNQSDTFAILDVTNGLSYRYSNQRTNLAPLLVGEAASFVAMWNSLSASHA